MRLNRLFLVLLVPLLLGCKLLPPVDGLAGSAPADAMAADGEAVGVATPVADTTVRPKPRPGSAAVQEPAIATPDAATTSPAVRITREQAICERQGGRWGNAGDSTSKTCIKRTRDGGQQCRKENDCDGLCLARSGTCAPVKPLFGCNEILQDDGRRATLCVN